jgi:hypothetical protein
MTPSSYESIYHEMTALQLLTRYVRAYDRVSDEILLSLDGFSWTRKRHLLDQQLTRDGCTIACEV